VKVRSSLSPKDVDYQMQWMGFSSLAGARACPYSNSHKITQKFLKVGEGGKRCLLCLTVINFNP
jgi:hypothetical protein